VIEIQNDFLSNPMSHSHGPTACLSHGNSGHGTPYVTRMRNKPFRSYLLPHLVQIHTVSWSRSPPLATKMHPQIVRNYFRFNVVLILIIENFEMLCFVLSTKDMTKQKPYLRVDVINNSTAEVR
jgi:hypothetical protein